MKALSQNEFKELCAYVDKHHSPFQIHSPVKYIDVTYDSRTQDIFLVRFRGFGVEKQFHVGDQEEGRMIEEIYKYLKGLKNEK